MTLKSSYKARQAYRKYYGKIPKGCDIHHRDRNKLNNSPDNLIALTRSEHLQEHSRKNETGWGRYWNIPST